MKQTFDYRVFLIVLALIFPASVAFSQESAEDAKKEPSKSDLLYAAIRKGDVESVKQFNEDSEGTLRAKLQIAAAHQNRGVQRFFESNVKGSIEDFDAFLKLRPEEDPYHWQRGISYYYADRFQDGKEQFERHQTVNTQDVENAVWHFLCSIRAPGGSLESAQKNLIPITQDTRVPMKEVHALFAGTGTAEQVIAAAKKEGDPSQSEQAKNAMLYAHLYLGIYYEALGKDELVKTHIGKAAGEFKMDHYMGKVAQVHAKLREIDPAK